MLEPIHNSYTNTHLGAPQDWDERIGPCHSLPCHHDGKMFSSWYRLTWADRFRALLGAPIRLSIIATSHPVISIEIDTDKNASSKHPSTNGETK